MLAWVTSMIRSRQRIHEHLYTGICICICMSTRGGFRGGRAPPPPKIRKAYVIQR